MSLVFTQITNNEFTGRCTELLENRMQCYTGAIFNMHDSLAPENPSRQVCRYHARLLYDNEQRNLANQTNPEAKEKTDGSTS